MNVLLIEDSDTDFRLVERALGDAFELTRATDLAGGIATFLFRPKHFDLVILDLTLDDSSGYKTFERASAAFGRIPILVLSGLEDEDLSLRAVANGAQDFIRKSRLLDYPLDHAARYAVERRKAEETARHAQQQYQTLFESLPMAAYTCDASGLLTYFNQRAVQLWGRTPKLNDPADRFCGAFGLYTTDGKRVQPENGLMAIALRDGVSFNGTEAVLETPWGERRSILKYVTPVVDEDHSIRGAINLLVDVTAQRQIESKLRDSERFASSIVNSLWENIAILDETGTVLAVNTAWQQCAQEEGTCLHGIVVGTNFLQACDQRAIDDAPEAAKTAEGIRSILQGNRDRSYTEYACHSPTQQRWFAISVTPFEGEGPTRVVVKHENITAIKLAEKLAREQAGLRHAVAGMQQFIGVVGHELRTPLATLGALSEFLTTPGARQADEADKFLHQISEEVARMSDTVDKILEAAQSNSGIDASNWTVFDLSDVITAAVADISTHVDSEAVAIQTLLDPPSCQMHGDPNAIQLLVKNILSNSARHTTRGRIIVRVKQLNERDGHWAVLTISDTGSGIPPEIYARLGEAFALNSSGVGDNYVSGLGLGLASCKKIASAHGGDLTIETVQGRGTVVTARLRTDLTRPIVSTAAVVSD
jgi:signal transduction histidine kinase/DNA-binding NarL/FixJ family response regulator